MAEEQPRTKIWLVNGESLTVDGDVDSVVSALNAGRVTALQSGDNRVYVNPQHVTHLQEVQPPLASFG